MGNTEARLRKAEEDVLSLGVAWYNTWKAEHQEWASSTDCRLTFEASSVRAGPVADPLVDPAGKGASRGEETALSPQIHTVSYKAGKEGRTWDQPPLVVIHGFGCGIGHMYSVMPPLADRWRGPVYAIDMLGSGLSSRPKWTMGFGDDVAIDVVESYVLESCLFAWHVSSSCYPLHKI